MSYEYVEIGGKELVNPSRTLAYITNLLPGLDVECEIPNIGNVIGSRSYSAPLADNAPWITSDPASRDFLGGIQTSTEGLHDSTQTISVTELWTIRPPAYNVGPSWC